MNTNKWLIPVMAVVGLVVVIFGGVIFNKWAAEEEMRGIIADTEVGIAVLAPVSDLLREGAKRDPQVAEINAVLRESIKEAGEAHDWAKKKDLEKARYHYNNSVVKLELFDNLLQSWVKSRTSR